MSDVIHKYGVVSSEVMTLSGKGIAVHTKTTLFNALLMISGAEVVAQKMMDLHPQGKFHHLRVDHTPSLALVMHPDRREACSLIARQLVERGSFKLDDYELDVATGKKITILEYLVQEKDHELLSLMVKTGLYNFDAFVEVSMFPAMDGVTPLMFYAQLGDMEAIRILVESEVNINLLIEVDTGHGRESCNALSFAKNNMEIVEYLIENGCEYYGTTVGLTNFSQNGNVIEDLFQYSSTVQKLLADRVFYQESVRLIEQVGASDINAEPNLEIVEKVEELGKKRKSDLVKDQSVIEVEEVEDLDSLLLQYFVTRNEEIADQIRTLCNSSSEVAIKLISSLQGKYFEHADVDEVVTKLIYDPKLVHGYFQERKALTQFKMQQLDQKTSLDHVQGWEIGEDFIKMESVIPVKTTMRDNVYIKISDDLVVPKMALDNLKLLPTDSLGINGIKFRTDLGIVILKTKALGDDRLVARGIHKNAEGDMLIIFTDMCNHAQVENWSKSVSPLFDSHILPDSSINLLDETEAPEILGENEDITS